MKHKLTYHLYALGLRTSEAKRNEVS